MSQSGNAPSVRAWADRLREALAEITGSRPAMRWTQSDPAVGPDILWWQPSDVPAISVGIGESDAALLLQLRGKELAGPSQDAVKAGFSELMNRVWGNGDFAAQRPADHTDEETCTAEFPSGETVRFLIAHPAPASQCGPNLDILMDIELPITLRFGSTRMALRDIAALGTGSVIEFDRGVDDPVEVLVNGHIVARGEAVVVQGSYGVRILEISRHTEGLVAQSFSPLAGSQPRAEGNIS